MKEKKEQLLVYRQGDVAFLLVNIDLDTLKKKGKALNSKTVAIGEHGNAHTIEGILFEFNGNIYAVNPYGDLIVRHPEHDEIIMPGGPENVYEVLHQRELHGEVRD